MTNDLLVNAVVESDDSDLDGDASTDTYVAVWLGVAIWSVA